MQQLVACAISIDDVRDIFGAAPALAERLRGLAAQRLAPASPAKRRWFGPVLRRDRDDAVDPRTPTPGDVDTLLAGGYVEPDRLPQCWTLFVGCGGVVGGEPPHRLGPGRG